MDAAKAKKTGFIQTFKAITAGLIVAYFLMASIGNDAFWLLHTPYPFLFLFGIVFIYSAGFLFGRATGNAILVKHKPALLTGVLCGFLIVWTSVIFASLAGLFSEGLKSKDPLSELLVDYVGKSLWLVTGFGCVPILLAGLWLGYSIKRKAKA